MNIISDHSVANLAWLNASNTVEKSVASRVSMWPIFTFLGLMFGAPYLISRMLPREDVPESSEYPCTLLRDNSSQIIFVTLNSNRK